MITTNGKPDFTEFITGSLERAWQQYSEALTQCKVKFSEKAVHDLRVAIRRLLALNRVINSILSNDYSVQLHKDLKKQLKSFNPLRDTQVQLLVLKDMIYSFPVLYSFYNSLLKKEVRLIQNLKKEMAVFSPEDIRGSSLFLKLFLKDNIKKNGISFEILFKESYKSFMEVLHELSEANTEDLATIHKVRLRFKRFRYIMEILQPVTHICKTDIKKMKAFQTILGNIQDNRVMLDSLNDFITDQTEIAPETYIPVREDLLKSKTALLENYSIQAMEVNTLWQKKRVRLKGIIKPSEG